MVSLAVDRGAAADPLPVDDEDGKGCPEGGQWTQLKQEEQQPGLRKHEPAIGICRPQSSRFTPLHNPQWDSSLPILHRLHGRLPTGASTLLGPTFLL